MCYEQPTWYSIQVWDSYTDMKYGCCKECTCVSQKIRDPGCPCKKHDQYNE